MKLIDPQSDEGQGLFLGKWTTPFVYSRTHRRAFFPLFDGLQNLQGIVRVFPVDNDDVIRFKEMSDFIQLTLGEYLKSRDHQIRLERIEKILQIDHTPPSLKNVIPWPLSEKKRSDTDPIVAKFIDKAQKPVSNKSYTPLWLFGQDNYFLCQLGDNCHNWVKNWALINTVEVPDLIWDPAADWLDYPQVTLLFPDADKLSVSQRLILESNLKVISNHKGPKPLIILTSQESPDEIMPQCSQYFKSYRASQKIPMDAQSHFVVFNQQRSLPWRHFSPQWNRLFFFPMSRGSKSVH